MRGILAGVVLIALVVPVYQSAHAQTDSGCGVTPFYVAARGTAPSAQALSFFAFGPAVTETVGTSATLLDTLTNNSAQAGYLGQKVPKLDRTRGYTVTFGVEILREAHATAHRAGFSLIVLSNDKRGIELGFWEDRIWAQEGGAAPALFTQAESVAISTTVPASYTLHIKASGYVLSRSGAVLLTGTLRNYGAFSGFPDPYETPNFLFLGDDTGSAGAIAAISSVSLDRGICQTFIPKVRAKPRG